MFRNKSAWFSHSVPPACHNFWRLEGGTITGWRTADYLFSEDATCPDTLRIFESKDYLWNKVVVFHVLFLSICEKRRSVKSVSIGHFVLPPISVQEEVRNVAGRLIWEREHQQSPAQSSSHQREADYPEEVSRTKYFAIPSEPIDTDGSESEACLSGNKQEYPVCNKLTGYVSMKNLWKYSGDLCDVHPGGFRCSDCKACCCSPRDSK
ncbi:telomere repeats-binding bouquet formation protein 2 [Brachionichthys hirsutus]|uniref:telomere repeats-binding bouquet formation protein 2 n=1 Tax=Brachionichthys hirsutus TaxID=412623 RepID=UPI0036046D02